MSGSGVLFTGRIVRNTVDQNQRWFIPRGGGALPQWGGLFPGCAISGLDTPHFDKARQRRKFDPFVRQFWEKMGKNDLKMYDSEDFRKFLPLKSGKHAFLRGETSNLSKNGPCCKALLRLKRDPFVRQNFESRPFCKAKSSKTHPPKWHSRVYRIKGEPPPQVSYL